MTTWGLLGIAMIFGIGCVTPVPRDDRRGVPGGGQERWWRGEWREEFWNGPCEVKLESKRGEFKREIKCKDGAGARWRESGQREYRDGPCTVKVEAKRDEYKEEVKCDR
jgi:hypothetical protein